MFIICLNLLIRALEISTASQHFCIYFRHSITLDSSLLKFSFRFFYQTSMNARAKVMIVT